MDWRIAWQDHAQCKDLTVRTASDILQAGLPCLDAQVPGNFELDLMRAGKLEDLYYSANTLLAQKLETTHVWYFTTVSVTVPSQYLRFEGIDTFADIYVDGQLLMSTANMFLPYDVRPDWAPGEHEVVVHILPAMLEARKFTLPAACNAQKYSYPTLYLRKAAHMFGWDIMPRIVSAGLWKDVTLCDSKADRITEVYFATHEVDLESKTAQMRFYIHADLSGNFATDYSVRIEGCCGSSSFRLEEQLWHTCHAFNFFLSDCKFWWPKNAGEANLYDTSVTLLKGGKAVDVHTLKLGIRTVELDRTESTTEAGDGEFCFRVNGKKIFVLGTNWVPLDAFPSQDPKRLPQALALLDEIGCNMVRCWGGNVYESEEFFDFCDTHGILVWQDFAMGCAVYPQDQLLARQLEEEVIYQIKRLRNHASLALWAGDNENDLACFDWNGFKRDPTHNFLTRQLLPRLVAMHDYARPFLPSSPYMSEAVYRGNGILPENHLWGPRDYFKGDFYKNTFCHFASETGYHGFPSPVSLDKFLADPDTVFRPDGSPTDEYLIHAAAMETDMDSPYAYRIRLAYNQVVTLFGKAAADFHDFLKQSQISQAEAKKYFIEKFRIGKWKRTGIIWWNLLDGWPQVSDAIVDYYGCKKLAYHYIKRTQNPVCLMFDEPVSNSLTLFGVNDTPRGCRLSYRVKRFRKDGGFDVMLTGQAELKEDSSGPLAAMAIDEGEKYFYLIQWELEGKTYRNHYFTNILDIDYNYYMAALQASAMDEFEGF